jgi:hypothetical protein
MAKEPNANIDPDWTPPVKDAPKQDAPDPILELKAQLERERVARIEAENKANEYAQNAHKSQNEVADSQLQLVNSAIDRVRESNAILKSAYAEAMRASDFENAAEIQSQMADNAARLLQLENGKSAMESQPKPEAPQPIRTMQQDPVEAIASQLTPRSAAWVRAHPECARDAKLYHRMIDAHNRTVESGIAPDTDEYFEEVEERIFGDSRRKAQDADTGADDPMAEAAKAVPSRQAAPPAAPVSRGSSSRTAHLTEAEKEIAASNNQTEQEYAKFRDEMIKNGRIGTGRIH